MGYIRNAVLLHAPIDDVFALTNNVRTWPDLFTEYASSEVISEEENTVVFRLTTHPDESGMQWSWIATRKTDHERKSTFSQRDPASGPFQHMTIRWWYDRVNTNDTVMTWEQEFTLKPEAPMTDEGATRHLNTQTRIQQQVIKTRIEHMKGTPQPSEETYRGVIIARYEPGSEEKIVEAFKKSDATELPRQIGVTSRHVWVQGDIYVHFVGGSTTLPAVLKEYSDHPLFKEVKAELDQYVSLIYPNLPPAARQIYEWRSDTAQGTNADGSTEIIIKSKAEPQKQPVHAFNRVEA